MGIFNHLFHFLLYLSNGIAFTGRITEELYFLAEVVVLLHGGERDDDRGLRLSLDGDVSYGHADPDNPVVNAVDLDELSAGVFPSWEQALVDTLPDDTHFPLVADVDVVDETSEYDVGFFNLLVFGIQAFQGS